MKYIGMTKEQILVAETFSYSYKNYENHLGIGNKRFDKSMPDDIKMIQKYEQEGWDIEYLAHKIQMEVKLTEELVKRYQRAKELVYAPNADTAFKIGVRHSIEIALEQGLSTPEGINDLVEQICYRVADLAYLKSVLETEKVEA